MTYEEFDWLNPLPVEGEESKLADLVESARDYAIRNGITYDKTDDDVFDELRKVENLDSNTSGEEIASIFTKLCLHLESRIMQTDGIEQLHNFRRHARYEGMLNELETSGYKGGGLRIIDDISILKNYLTNISKEE